MAGSSRTGGGGSGGSGFVRGLGQRGVSYVRGSSSRQTVFLLIVAILLARLALTNQLQTFWASMFAPTRPLGEALPAKVQAANAKASKSNG